MKTVITTHKNMDLDGLGALVGLKKLYPEAEVVLPDTKGEDVLFVLRENPDILDFTEEGVFCGDRIDRLIVADTDSLDRIPESVKSAVTKETEIIVFDHHSREFEVPAKVFFKETGSTSSIVTLFLKGKGVVPSPYEASLLLLGIYSDTGSFKYPNTTPMDFIAAAYLLGIGAELSFVKRYLPKELSGKELDILKIMKDNLTVLDIHGNKVGLTYGRFDEYVGEVSQLVSKLLEIRDLPALFGVFEVQGTTFLIGRSQSEKIDVSKIVEPFGGGGHREAASASVKGKTVFEILDELKRTLFEKIEPLVKAKDIMTSPPIVIREDTSVSEGRLILMKNSINAAPVIDLEGKIVGIVTRSLLDKAFYMGLENEKISNVAEKEFYSVSPEASIGKVEEIIAEKHQSFVPVLISSKPVGVITRTDLLVNSYREEISELSNFYRKRVSSPPKFRNVKELIKKALPEETYQLLETIGKLAERENLNVYIVGGFVRDLIIGRKNYDIDIVVEGDATKFAKVVGKELEAKVHTFSRFKTATVVFKDGTRLDMASARTEIYKSPGALPEVDIAPLKKDLFRRDFTINTLAVKINYSDFGKLIDFFGGLKDIRDRKIRVLHSLSFVEDPTRILRALRFSARYRFELGKHTEKLLKMAVEKKLFKTVEGQRIYHELKQILLEDNPLRVFLKLEKYGIISELFPGLKWNREKKDSFERARKLIIWHKINFPERKTEYQLVYLSSLFFREPIDKVKGYLNSLSFPKKEGEKLLKFLADISRTYPKLRKLNLPSEIYQILKGKDEEFLLLLGTLFPELEEKIVNFMKNWRFVEPLVSGEDIKKLGLKPGPAFKEILNKVKYEIIDGKISKDSRKEQLSRLKELVVELGKDSSPI